MKVQVKPINHAAQHKRRWGVTQIVTKPRPFSLIFNTDSLVGFTRQAVGSTNRRPLQLGHLGSVCFYKTSHLPNYGTRKGAWFSDDLVCSLASCSARYPHAITHVKQARLVYAF